METASQPAASDAAEARGQRRPLRARFILVAVLAVAALLIFFDLGDRYLWEDEAETALLARNVLRFGLPVGWDGHDLISQECGIELNENYISRRHGWLPIYLAAASFKLLGQDTIPARLPSAVLGWLSVLSIYLLARRIFQDERLALLSAALLTFSVPFLLYARQSRYYTLALFVTIWALIFFLDVLAGRRFAWVGLAVSLTVMFHTLLPMVVGTVLAFAVLVVALERRRELLRPFLLAGGLALGLSVPWLGVYGLPWAPSFTDGSSQSLLHPLLVWGENVAFYLASIDQRVVPLFIPVALIVGLVATGGLKTLRVTPESRPQRMLLLFAVVYLLFAAAYPKPFFRYLVNLLPVLAVLVAWLAHRIWSVSRPLAVAVVLVIVATDALHGWTIPAALPFRASFAKVSSPLWSYVDELATDDQGPIESIARHLKQEARPGDRLFISYGDLPLRFYTNLEIRGGQGCQSLAGWPLPEWVVVRFFVRFRPDGAPPEHHEDVRRTVEYIRALPKDGYRLIGLPVVDTFWDNIPEPGYHRFRAPLDGPRVSIYRRIDAPPGGAAAGPRAAATPRSPQASGRQ